MIILEADSLIKIYGEEIGNNETKALNKISLKIEKGEFVGIMGPSGSGKTTFLNILSGIDKPTSGWVKIADKKICDMNRNDLAFYRRKHLGFVFQEFNMIDSLTIKENIMLPLILDMADPDEMDDKTNKVMKMFNIESIENKYPYKTSGGQQQRAAIGRAIINDPDIIFADEPTGNLDSKASKDVMTCFEKMNQTKAHTILVVTHDPFTASYCNRVVFIKDGAVNMEIEKTEGKKEFFDRILDCLSIIGDDKSSDI